MGADKLFSEKFKNDKRRNQEKAKSVLAYQISKMFAEQSKEERFKNQMNRVGNGKYIEAGIIARLFDIYDLSLDLDKIENKGNVNSFLYGYYETANIQLKLLSTGVIPGRVMNAITTKKIDLDYELTPENILFNVGARDAFDENIKIESLPVEVQNNKFYLEGYKKAIEKLQSKGRR